MQQPLSRRRGAYFGWKLAASLVALAFCFFFALTFGAADTSFRDVLMALFTSSSEKAVLTIRELRLPRELAAMAVGSALAVAGAVMQGMTRNPLADPGLLGLTAGANLMLALTIALFPNIGYIGIMIGCFIGSTAAALLVFGISASRSNRFSPLRIVLAGAAISALLFAASDAVSLHFKISQQVNLWNAGGVIGTTWKQLALVTPFIGAGILGALLLSRQLTVLSMSEEVSTGLGQNTALAKTLLFVVVVLLTGAAVALVGNMAFVGLLVPHVARAIVGPDYRFVLPVSAVGGAALLLLADTFARTVNSPYETSLTAIVAMLGLPFFLWIVNRKGGAFR
ncbi:FecCD family ABC transporter permease [Paenibacillus pasadenensis]|uniref:ABC-type Fe3+-siderophore transport system, permease component n=1 Tax=Paenibacillus pasadenensis TaxID=217090 RepID=A0A2N5N4P0_9BACL|nr:MULTISPECIES: iron ABC transporter permease [Paenibacillus]PLT45280.1 ABC-type Fe3+-siderophore transport system, permease component [Paenibacillus pasadenensis]QGG55686.1 iron chelate uptake ABC transporter family permease subunit [Paenibacillus sp. B01]